jgi:phosphatidylserine decarboxylase
MQCDQAEKKGKKLSFMIIYLAPGDYHRYHAATSFVTNFRRHIVGWLEPVKPSYLQGHPNVFKTNERVTVFGDWAKGYFSMTFVGATNVGSMTLNFDPELETNSKSFQGRPFYFDKNYTKLTEFD